MLIDAASAPGVTDQVAALFEQYHVEIYGYLARLLRDRQAAEDLVQETFLRALRSGGQLRGIENPRAWLYRIATNLALNWIKRRGRLAWLPWRANRGDSNDYAESLDLRNEIEKALAHLPADHQALLILSIHFGFTLRELALALGTSEGAIKVRMFRAREQFRQAYRGGEQG